MRLKHKVLVTGGAGFIGSHLALKLQDLGHDVIIIDNFSTGSLENIRHFKGHVIRGDIRDSEKLYQLGKVGAIFHEASITTNSGFYPPGSVVEGMDANVIGFAKLLEYARWCNAKLVYASSSATIPEPGNFYGLSKIMIEGLANMYNKEHGLHVIGLRYFNTFGIGEESKGKAANMVSQFLWSMLNDETPIVYGDGEQSRDFIYVKDVVSATIKAMESDAECDVFEIGTGVPTSYNALIRAIGEHLHKEIKPKYVETPLASYQLFTQAETERAEKVLGFKANYDLETALAEMIVHFNTTKTC